MEFLSKQNSANVRVIGNKSICYVEIRFFGALWLSEAMMVGAGKKCNTGRKEGDLRRLIDTKICGY